MLIFAPGATLARQDIGCVHRIACHGTVRFVGIFYFSALVYRLSALHFAILILAPGATLARQDTGCVHRIVCHGTVRSVGIVFQRVGFSVECIAFLRRRFCRLAQLARVAPCVFAGIPPSLARYHGIAVVYHFVEVTIFIVFKVWFWSGPLICARTSLQPRIFALVLSIGCAPRIACHGTVRFVGIFISVRWFIV